jgi:hypothetical protein
MSQGADIASPEILEELCAALKRFSEQGQETLAAARRDIEHTLETLQERCDERRRELARCKRDYDSADHEEDDLGHLANRVEEAQDQLREANRWLRRSQEAYENYRRDAQRFADLVSNQSERAILFLRQRHKELEDYLALRMDGDASASAGSSAGLIEGIAVGLEQAAGIVVGSTFDAAGGALSGLMNAPLPQGFQWVCLDQLSEQAVSELPDDGEYRKVSQETVRAGLDLLRREILPAIAKNSTVDSFYFEQADRQAERDPATGARAAYDAFFGSEPIAFDRTLDGRQWNITNGRHRIRIARELGWLAVPARIIGR